MELKGRRKEGRMGVMRLKANWLGGLVGRWGNARLLLRRPWTRLGGWIYCFAVRVKVCASVLFEHRA